MNRRYFVVNERGERVPGMDGETRGEAIAELPRWDLARAAGYRICMEDVPDEDETEEADDMPVSIAANHGYEPQGVKRIILELLAEGPATTSELAAETNKTLHQMNTHLYQLRCYGHVAHTDTRMPKAEPRRGQNERLWALDKARHPA